MSTVKQPRLLFDSKLKAERDYWVAKLSGEMCASGLAADFERPAATSGARVPLALPVPDELSNGLSKFAGDSPVLLYAALLTALKVYLHRCNEGGPVVVGSPPLRGDGPASQTPNVLATVDEVDEQLSFRALVVSVHENLLEAYERQSYPFDRLLKDLGVEEPDNRSPLFDVVLVLGSIHGDLPELRNDLTFIFDQTPGRLSLEVSYNPELFHGDTVRRSSQHLINLLSAATKAPDDPIINLDIVDDEERELLARSWASGERRDFSGPALLHAGAWGAARS
ncbi:MAG TPA: condensation domain-containing protein, partial [Pyrinomonadaceae bacterium]